jgi:Ca-activated chloride channel family protein
VSYVPAGAVGSALQPVAQRRLDQVASGRYSGEFDLGDAGVYLIRASSGAQMVSGGLVRNVSGQTATGRVNTTLLERVPQSPVGRCFLQMPLVVSPPAPPVRKSLTLPRALLVALLLVFLADVVIRRWGNVQGLMEAVRNYRRGE